MNQTEAIIAIVLSLFVMLFGYRLKKIVFFIAWFLIGFMLSKQLIPMANELVPEIANSSLWQNLIPVAGGLLLSLIGFSIEKFCVSMLAFACVSLFVTNQFGWDAQYIAIGAILGAVAGALAVRLMKPSVIIATAWSGATTFTQAFLIVVTAIDPSYSLIILIGMTFIASLFQFVTTKNIE